MIINLISKIGSAIFVAIYRLNNDHQNEPRICQSGLLILFQQLLLRIS